MGNTIDYYNEDAKKFIDGTVSVDFRSIQDTFLENYYQETQKYLILVVVLEGIPSISWIGDVESMQWMVH